MRRLDRLGQCVLVATIVACTVQGAPRAARAAPPAFPLHDRPGPLPFTVSDVTCTRITIGVRQQHGAATLSIAVNGSTIHTQTGLHLGPPIQKNWPADRLIAGENSFRITANVRYHDYSDEGTFLCPGSHATPSPAPSPTTRPPEPMPVQPVPEPIIIGPPVPVVPWPPSPTPAPARLRPVPRPRDPVPGPPVVLPRRSPAPGIIPPRRSPMPTDPPSSGYPPPPPASPPPGHQSPSAIPPPKMGTEAPGSPGPGRGSATQPPPGNPSPATPGAGQPLPPRPAAPSESPGPVFPTPANPPGAKPPGNGNPPVPGVGGESPPTSRSPTLREIWETVRDLARGGRGYTDAERRDMATQRADLQRRLLDPRFPTDEREDIEAEIADIDDALAPWWNSPLAGRSRRAIDPALWLRYGILLLLLLALIVPATIAWRWYRRARRPLPPGPEFALQDSTSRVAAPADLLALPPEPLLLDTPMSPRQEALLRVKRIIPEDQRSVIRETFAGPKGRAPGIHFKGQAFALSTPIRVDFVGALLKAPGEWVEYSSFASSLPGQERSPTSIWWEGKGDSRHKVDIWGQGVIENKPGTREWRFNLDWSPPTSNSLRE